MRLIIIKYLFAALAFMLVSGGALSNCVGETSPQFAASRPDRLIDQIDAAFYRQD